MLGHRGDCLGLGHPNSDWLLDALDLASMPDRAACRLAFLHSSEEIRPVLLKVPTPACTTPLHMGWRTQAMPMPPYRSPSTPTPRRVMPAPYHAVPSHSPASIPSTSPGLSACLSCGATSTDGCSSPLEPSVPGYGVGNTWTCRCLRGGVLHLTRQVSMLTVQGSQKVANLGVGDSPALQWAEKANSQQTQSTPCLHVCCLTVESVHPLLALTHSAPLPVQSSDPCSILLIKRSGLLGNVANSKV